MQTQTISKAPRKMRIEAIQNKRTFEEIDRLDNIARDAWVALYTAVQTGERDYIYWNLLAYRLRTARLYHYQTYRLQSRSSL